MRGVIICKVGVCLSMAVAGGCGGDDGNGPNGEPDAAPRDARMSDAAAEGGGAVDTRNADGPGADARPADSPGADIGVPDGPGADIGVPDGPGTDAGGADGASTDTAGQDAGARDALTSDAADGGDRAEASGDAPSPTCIAVSPFQVSEDVGASRSIGLAWNGNGYGLTWADDRSSSSQVYFARLDTNGTKIGADVRVTNIVPDAGSPPDAGPVRPLGVAELVWTGTEYGLFWMRDGVWFQKLDATGTPTTPVFVQSWADGNYRRVAWNGSRYGLAWFNNHEGDFEVYLTLVDAVGAKVGNDMRVTNVPGSSFTPSIAADTNGYGLVWHDNRGDGGFRIYFSHLDPMGVETVDDLPISATSGGGARLAWSGDAFGVVWGSNGNAQFVRVNTSGQTLGPETTLTTGATAATIAWTGRGFAVPQITPVAGDAGVIGLSLALTDAIGTKLGFDTALSNSASDETAVTAVGVGGGAAVAWIEKKVASTEVFFAVRCP